MARHNRDGQGADQRGFEYRVKYQPDWLRLVKVTRALEGGRQSTKTLCRNPSATRRTPPGTNVRTAIESPEQNLDFEIAVRDPRARITRIRVACRVEGPDGEPQEIEFTLEGDLPPSR